ncbi:AAA family ATPase [Spirillospora sp. NPDC052242]
MRNGISVSVMMGLAAQEAKRSGAPSVGPCHVLMGATKLARIDVKLVSRFDRAQRDELAGVARVLQAAFADAGPSPDVLRRTLRVAHLRVGAIPSPRGAAPPADPLVTAAVERGRERSGGRALEADELLYEMLTDLPDCCREVFMDPFGIADPVAALFPNGRPAGPPKEAAPDGRAPKRNEPKKDEPKRDRAPRPEPKPEPVATPYLDKYGRDLTREAREGRPPELIGRRAELRSLARVLVRQRKPNAVLVGPAGVGKTGIVEALAARLAAPGAPPDLAGSRIVEISMSTLLAGAKYRGDFERRLGKVLKEAEASPEVILFIDELHTVLGAGRSGPGDAADILKPALARGRVRCVGATTPEEYARHIERDSALRRRFEVVWVEEPSPEEAVTILRGLLGGLAEHHGVRIEDDVARAAVDLAVRHLPHLRHPDKAIDLVDGACAAARIRTLGPDVPGEAALVRAEDVAAQVAERARTPIEPAASGEADRLLRMEAHLARRVIGQDEAVREVAEAVRAARAGLGDPRRPIGVFLLAGPTGTGKTELAKAAAEFLFGDERRLVAVDMSEYQDRYTVNRLLGAPPGYVGHDREGQLTGPLREHPHSVVLFDEIEKAHERVLDVLLQICDEGRLTDARGRRVDFTETLIFLTSNLADPAERLRPELVGRLSGVIAFRPLDAAALGRIVDKLIDRVRSRGAAVELTDAARQLLVFLGLDSPSGVRTIERAIEREIVRPLGGALLAGLFREGEPVRVDAAGGELVLRGAEAS